MTFLSLVIYTVFLYLFKLKLNDSPEMAPVPHPPVSHLERYLLVFTCILAIVIRIKWMDRALLFDEIHNVLYCIDVDSVWTVVSSSYGFSNHIGHSLAAYPAKILFGTGNWVFRLPALLLGVSSLFYMWHFGRKYFGPKVTMIALLALAVSPTHVNWSVSARGYAGMLFFGLIMIHQFLELLQKPSKTAAIIYVFAATLGIYFHVYTTLIVISQAVFLIYRFARRVFFSQRPQIPKQSFIYIWLGFGLSAFFSIILYLPVLTQMLDSLKDYSHVKIFRERFPLDLLQALADGPIYVSLLVGSAFATGLLSFSRSRTVEFHYYLFLFLFPTLFIWLSRPYYLYPRFFYYLLPVFLLFAGTGALYILRKIEIYRFKRLLHIALFCLLLLIFSNWITHSWTKIFTGRIERVANIIKKHADRDTGFCAIGIGSNLFEYYLDQMIVPKNIDEFNALTSKYARILCVYNERPGVESAQHTTIGRYLEKHATILYDRHFKVFEFEAVEQSIRDQ